MSKDLQDPNYRPSLSQETRQELEKVKDKIKTEEEHDYIQKRRENDGQEIESDVTEFKWRRPNKQMDVDWIIRKALQQMATGEINVL